jgi:acetyl esterase
VHAVENRSITGSGASIPIRIYKAAPDRANRGALVYFHGGGWVIGSLDSHDETARRLCAGSGCTVVSVDYRLAPETRYPGAMIDCFDATCWVAKEAANLGIDPARIAVGGDSAGGNLAAAVALKARDASGPLLAFQLLIYPATEPNFETRSYQDNATGYLLTRSAMQWFWDHYVPSAAARDESYASPLRAKSLRGLPPALVITAEFDPLRDEGEAYAEALAAAGVDTGLTRYDGVVHGFFGMHATVAKSLVAIDQSNQALRHYLGD